MRTVVGGIFKVLALAFGLYLVAAAVVVAVSQLATTGQRDLVRRFNRDRLNPWMLKRAGGERWYASVIEHEGRTSGSTYRTPVMMHPTARGFAVPLPYGEHVDWLRNLRHAGTATAVHRGVAYRLSVPHVVDRAVVSDALGPRDALRYAALGIDRFLTVEAEPIPEGALTTDV